jgi:hypothetical protein
MLKRFNSGIGVCGRDASLELEAVACAHVEALEEEVRRWRVVDRERRRCAHHSRRVAFGPTDCNEREAASSGRWESRVNACGP